MRLDPTEGKMPALLVCDLTLGGCRHAGAKKAPHPVGRVGSDPQPAICRITRGRRADHGWPGLFPRRVARTRDRAGGDEPRYSLSGSLMATLSSVRVYR